MEDHEIIVIDDENDNVDESEQEQLPVKQEQYDSVQQQRVDDTGRRMMCS